MQSARGLSDSFPVALHGMPLHYHGNKRLTVYKVRLFPQTSYEIVIQHKFLTTSSASREWLPLRALVYMSPFGSTQRTWTSTLNTSSRPLTLSLRSQSACTLRCSNHLRILDNYLGSRTGRFASETLWTQLTSFGRSKSMEWFKEVRSIPWFVKCKCLHLMQNIVTMPEFVPYIEATTPMWLKPREIKVLKRFGKPYIHQQDENIL